MNISSYAFDALCCRCGKRGTHQIDALYYCHEHYQIWNNRMHWVSKIENIPEKPGVPGVRLVGRVVRSIKL